jgi:hypothetical protein
MATFSIRINKNKAQTITTIKNVDEFDLTGTTTITANTYLDVLLSPVTTYDFTAPQVAAFVADDQVDITVLDLIGVSPVDGFYTVVLDVDDGTHDSTDGGVGITLEATSEVYSKQGVISVQSPDFFVPQVVHVCKMWLDEMNELENLPLGQRKDQFDRRLNSLKQILRYE